jgi:hypothetical protein
MFKLSFLAKLGNVILFVGCAILMVGTLALYVSMFLYPGPYYPLALVGGMVVMFVGCGLINLGMYLYCNY